ncbi:hypothetical protein F4802DRAFT_247140 [Xylaria palmicola]|nr:hypothetical protein F4802DRAFT_247140 [Xylaria palmicola]
MHFFGSVSCGLFVLAPTAQSFYGWGMNHETLDLQDCLGRLIGQSIDSMVVSNLFSPPRHTGFAVRLPPILIKWETKKKPRGTRLNAL